jgi:diguanylate cyclase (GGDEF)-like protein/PAS domain S-box-containing protein
VYLYAILAAALFALIRSLKHARDLYRRQILTLIAGMSLPWLGNVFSLTGLSPFGDLDLTPFFFFLSGTVIALGLFRYRFLDIVPVARELLVESMSDGIIVVDGKRRVVDINPATKKILGIDEGIIGKPVSEIRELDSGSCKLDLENPGQSGECFAQASPGRSFEFTVSMLKDGEKRAKGWLILLHDITERKKFEEELRRKGSHDTLTGLYNRQHYEEVMTELEAPGREAVSIIMIDLDGLKDINDAWGHAAGDDIIRETASILQETVGSDDILARAGGDEFLIIMPDTYAVEASERVDAIRRRIRARNAAKPGRPDIGISMGLAGRMVGESLATTLKRADDAMYAEKYRKKDIRSRLGRFGSPDTPPPSR